MNSAWVILDAGIDVGPTFINFGFFPGPTLNSFSVNCSLNELIFLSEIAIDPPLTYNRIFVAYFSHIFRKQLNCSE